MRRTFLSCSIVAVLITALPAAAATITFDTACVDSPTTITATSATCVSHGSTATAGVNITDLSHISVSASISPPGTWGRAYVQYDADLTITFIAPPGAPAEAVYIPCISGSPNGFAVFDGLSIFEGAGGSPNPHCESPNIGTTILFTFGVPQTQPLRLAALSYYGGPSWYGADAYASFSGFRVYDLHLKPITGVQWVVTEVPEPVLALPLVGVFAAIAWKRRLRNRGGRPCGAIN